MKKFFAALLTLVATAAFSATTVPVQLINPSGSTSGQAIVSNGSSSAPSWGAIGTNGIGAIAANTVLANATGSSAAPTAYAMPSCSVSTSALQYTSGTGIVCGTGYAKLSGSNFVGPVTIALTSPTFFLNETSGSGTSFLGFQNNGTNLWDFGANSSTGLFAIDRYVSGTFVDKPISIANSTGVVSIPDGIAGQTTAASSGTLGYLQTSTTTATSLTSGTPANCGSISLAAGVWDVTGVVEYVPAGTTTTSGYTTGVNSTSATYQTITGSFLNVQQTFGLSVPAGTASYQQAPTTRFVLSSTTTIYLVGAASFSVSTMTCNGFMRAAVVH
jgi:hypothetical protein